MRLLIRKVLLKFKWYFSTLFESHRIIANPGLGFRMVLESSDVSAPQLFFGIYEPEETKTMGDLLKPGMVALDIGANLGYFTLLMAKKVGSTGRIHSFESNPQMVVRLRQNVSLNYGPSQGCIRIHEIALGETDGEAEFFCPVRGHEGAGGLKNTHRAPIEKVITVPMRTLDSVLQEHDIQKVDFVKMDIEGGELNVLRGATQMLKNLQPIILFEAFEENTSPYNYRVFDILNYLEQRSYCVKQTGMTFNYVATPK